MKWMGIRFSGKDVAVLTTVLGIFFAALLPSTRSSTIGFDEPLYATAGHVYLQTNNAHYNYEHPPFLKTLLALPSAIVLKPKLPLNGRNAWELERYSFAREFLFESGNNGRTILQYARMVNIVLAVLTGILLYAVSLQLFSRLGATISLVSYTLLPTVKQSAVSVGLDTGFTFFILLCLLLWGLLLHQPTWLRFILCAVGTILPFLSKFSPIYLLVLFCMYSFLHYKGQTFRFESWLENALSRKKNHPLLSKIGMFILAFLLMLFTIWTVYGWSPVTAEEKSFDVTQEQIKFEMMQLPSVVENAYFEYYKEFTLLPYAFLKGIAGQLSHGALGHQSYFLGSSEQGPHMLLYYPIMLLNIPLAMTILVGWCIISCRRSPYVRILLLIALLYTALHAITRIYNGQVYLLPTYCLLCIAIGALGKIISDRLQYIGCTFLFIWMGIAAFPNLFPVYATTMDRLGVSDVQKYVYGSSASGNMELVIEYIQSESIQNPVIAYFGGEAHTKNSQEFAAICSSQHTYIVQNRELSFEELLQEKSALFISPFLVYNYADCWSSFLKVPPAKTIGGMFYYNLQAIDFKE